MKDFDKVIMNPPYRNIYVKLTMKLLKSYRQEMIVLCPLNCLSSSNTGIRDEISSFEKVLCSFDADFGVDLGILKFNPTPLLQENIRFWFMKDKELSNALYTKSKEYPSIKSLGIKTFKREGTKNKKIFVPQKDTWYVGIPEVRGRRWGEVFNWDFYSFCALEDIPLRGRIKDTWAFVVPFSTEEEALLFRKYLDTDLAMFFLKLVKRDCVLYNHLGEVPYIRDEETFISSIEGYSKEKVLSYITEETKGYGFKYKKV